MKHLSLIAVIACLAFTPAGKSSTTLSANPADDTPGRWVLNDEASLQVSYYWFTYPDDSYWDHKTVADEINEMWIWYGTTVDTRPAGGTLIDRGYNSIAYPHIFYPSVYLYVHY
jgi:hypothetical protein